MLLDKKILPCEKETTDDMSYIVDFKDGSLYNEFRSQFEINRFKFVYSFMLNTDGISLCSKSNLAIWPIYLTINELNKKWRFSQECVIHAGLYVGYQKPPMDVFLKPIIEQLLDLETGFIHNNTVYYFYLLNANFDKPARALMLMMINSTGYFGCLKCLHPGESVPYGEGFHIIYDPKNNFPKRNARIYTNDLLKALLEAKTYNGIKNKCILSRLKFFKPIESTNIDSMHTIWLGFCKLHFQYLFGHKSTHNYSLKSNLVELNQRLLACKPPSFVTQAPRSLNTFHNWRAHEFMNFYLFFAIPTFKGIMKDVYFNHLLLFIVALENIFCEKIERENLSLIREILNEFVLGLEDLYDKHILVSGAHELIHLIDCTLEQGPLNDTSLFTFEELNRKITKSIKGQNLVGDEFIKKWSISLSLSVEIEKLYDRDTNNLFFDYIRGTFQIRSSNDKKDYKEIKLSLGKKMTLDFSDLDELVSEYLCKTLNIPIDEEGSNSNVVFLERVYVNSIQYSIYNSTKKFINSCIKFNGQVGLIEFIFTWKGLVFLLCI